MQHFSGGVFLLAFFMAALVCNAQSISSGDGQPLTNLQGQGSSFAFPVLDTWAFAYRLVKPSLQIQYFATGSSAGITALLTDQWPFCATDSDASAAQYDQRPDMQLYPLFGGGIVNIYNIPELGTTQLILDRLTLALIFNGTISMWNHPSIVATNPTVTMPAQQIRVVIRSDGSGTTTTLLEALNKFSATVNLPVRSRFPNAFLNSTLQPRFLAAPQTSGVIASVALVPYSISYSALAYLREITIPYAALINKAGVTVRSAELNTTELPLGNAAYDSRFVGSATDDPSPVSWPIVAITYGMILKNASAANVMLKREALRFLRWGLSDANPLERAVSLGYATLPRDIRDRVVTAMQDVQFDGRSLLAPTYVPQHNSGAYLASIIFGSIMCAVCMALLVVSLLGSGTSNERIYLTMMFVGGFGLFAATVMWYLIPSNTSICLARQWLTCAALAFMMTAIFSRMYQIHQIWLFYTVKHQRLTEFQLRRFYFASFGVSVGLQIIIQIVWSAVDPFSSISVPVNSVDITVSYQCACNNFWIWAGLEIAYFALLLAWGAYLLYRTWDIKQEVGESRWLLIAVYNVVICCACAIPLAISIPGEEQWSSLGVWICCVIAASTILLVLLPIVLKLWTSKYGKQESDQLAREGETPPISRDVQSQESEDPATLPEDVKEMMEIARRLQTQKRIAAQVNAEQSQRAIKSVHIVDAHSFRQEGRHEHMDL